MPIAVEINALLSFLSAGAALLVSFYAFRVNRLVESTLLRYISIGFMLLGAGLVAEGLTQAVTGATVITAARFSGLRLIVFILFTALQLVAYFIFAWGYALSAFGKQQPVLASAPLALLAASKTNVLRVIIFSLAVFLIAQLGIIILLLFVVVQGVFVYSRTKGTLTLTVLLAFLMIFVAHIILFSSVVFLSADLYLFGNVVQFLGFLALLFFLYTSGRVGTG